MPAPPSRNGVGASALVLPAARRGQPAWARVIDFLIERLPAVPAPEWLARMQAGEVLDESGQAIAPERPYQANLRVYYFRSLPHENEIPFEEQVVFRDDYLVVVDKPHFLPVTPTGKYVQQSLLVRLRRKLGIESLSPIHRIDRETAGLVAFCVQPAHRGAYQALFAQRQVHKVYEAVAPHRPELALPLIHRSRLEEDAQAFMQMREVPGEPNAETRIELIELLGDLAHYRLLPLTGRKHQLRAHCAALGMPICHDKIYPVLHPEGSDDYPRPLQLLARELAFRDPVSGTPRHFHSQLRLSLVAAANQVAKGAV